MTSETRQRISREGLLKISDLSRETSVSVATIKFYLREGLLPAPTLKTGRNMAYYDRSFVHRVRLIKELQQKRFLPLDVIKAILDRNDEVISSHEIDTLLGLQGTFYEAIHDAPGQVPLTHRQALERYGFEPEEIRMACELGVLTPVVRNGEQFFEGEDLLMLDVLQSFNRAGLDRELFPHRAAMPTYVECVEKLAREEMKIFSRAVTGRADEARTAELALSGVKLAEQFIVLLRRKLMLKLLAEMRAEKDAVESGGIEIEEREAG